MAKSGIASLTHHTAMSTATAANRLAGRLSDATGNVSSRTAIAGPSQRPMRRPRPPVPAPVPEDAGEAAGRPLAGMGASGHLVDLLHGHSSWVDGGCPNGSQRTPSRQRSLRIVDRPPAGWRTTDSCQQSTAPSTDPRSCGLALVFRVRYSLPGHWEVAPRPARSV